jgi:hypothetical protein
LFHAAFPLRIALMFSDSSANQMRSNLKLSSEHALAVVHIQLLDRGLSCGRTRQNQAGLAIQNKVKMPTQGRRFEIARIEQGLHSPSSVVPSRPIGLCKVATRATERQITHYGLTTAAAGQDMFDMERDPSSHLHQSAVFARASRAGYDQLPVRFGWSHLLSDSFGFDPNSYGDGLSRRTRCFAG